MKHLQQLALTLSLAVAAGGLPVSAQTLALPAAQQRPPATLEGQYPYRPACHQLIPQLSWTNPSFTGWGPVRNGQHESWYGLPTGMAIDKALRQLDAVGLCVLGGELVPWETIDEPTTGNIAAEASSSPKERTIQRLKSAPDSASSSDSFGVFVFCGLLAIGALALYERFEERPWLRRLIGEHDSTALAFSSGSTQILPASRERPSSPVADSDIPNRISPEALSASHLSNSGRQRTALEVLLASPFTSRAIYGFQRTGKTNLIASVTRQLAAQGVKVFALNLSSYGDEDTQYWEGMRSVRADFISIKHPDQAAAVIAEALALIDEFMECPEASIFVCDEWGYMSASHGGFVELLQPLIKCLADKITGLSSSGMKRRKALWTASPEIVAGEMEDFGKAVKKLSVCLVGIAPGHTDSWAGQELSFSWELYQQVSRNYPGVLSPPPADSVHARIAFINGEWLPLGTKALVPASVQDTASTPDSLSGQHQPPPVQRLPVELQTFREWLDKKVGEVIDYGSFNNANCCRKISRSKESYLLLCVK
ncbi:MAG: hypothetical protein WBD47_06980, partial [Phormidesmis sp.]